MSMFNFGNHNLRYQEPSSTSPNPRSTTIDSGFRNYFSEQQWAFYNNPANYQMVSNPGINNLTTSLRQQPFYMPANFPDTMTTPFYAFNQPQLHNFQQQFWTQSSQWQNNQVNFYGFNNGECLNECRSLETGNEPTTSNTTPPSSSSFCEPSCLGLGSIQNGGPSSTPKNELNKTVVLIKKGTYALSNWNENTGIRYFTDWFNTTLRIDWTSIERCKVINKQGIMVGFFRLDESLVKYLVNLFFDGKPRNDGRYLIYSPVQLLIQYR